MSSLRPGVINQETLPRGDEFTVLLTSLPNCHILCSFDPMSYLGADYLMVQLTVEQVDMATNVCF